MWTRFETPSCCEAWWVPVVRRSHAAGLPAEAAEAEDRVQLDRVGGDPGLAVVEVEEGDAGDAGAGAEADARAGGAVGPGLGACPRTGPEHRRSAQLSEVV